MNFNVVEIGTSTADILAGSPAKMVAHTLEAAQIIALCASNSVAYLVKDSSVVALEYDNVDYLATADATAYIIAGHCIPATVLRAAIKQGANASDELSLWSRLIARYYVENRNTLPCVLPHVLTAAMCRSLSLREPTAYSIPDPDTLPRAKSNLTSRQRQVSVAQYIEQQTTLPNTMLHSMYHNPLWYTIVCHMIRSSTLTTKNEIEALLTSPHIQGPELDKVLELMPQFKNFTKLVDTLGSYLDFCDEETEFVSNLEPKHILQMYDSEYGTPEVLPNPFEQLPVCYALMRAMTGVKASTMLDTWEAAIHFLGHVVGNCDCENTDYTITQILLYEVDLPLNVWLQLLLHYMRNTSTDAELISAVTTVEQCQSIARALTGNGTLNTAISMSISNGLIWEVQPHYSRPFIEAVRDYIALRTGDNS